MSFILLLDRKTDASTKSSSRPPQYQCQQQKLNNKPKSLRVGSVDQYEQLDGGEDEIQLQGILTVCAVGNRDKEK